MADRSGGEREMVFCHQCQNEWFRDTHGLQCPECQSEIVEIVSSLPWLFFKESCPNAAIHAY